MEELCISVAMCAYNGDRFLHDQLESIAGQTRLPDELVICDDGSTDESMGIIGTFTRRAPFPVRTHVNEKNLGSTKNFEKAISLCRGEMVALADQDDIWKPQKLAMIYTALQENPEAGYVFSDAELIDEYGVATGRRLWESSGEFVSSMQVGILLRQAVVTGATMAFRASLASVIVPFSPYFVHDYWISLIASAVGSYGVPINEPLIQYRQHGGQQIGPGKRLLLERVRRAKQAAALQRERDSLGLRDLRDRLLVAVASGWPCNASDIALVGEKVEHCSCRAAAHCTRGIARLRMVIAEALTGRYGRFSNSWQSIVEDMCF